MAVGDFFVDEEVLAVTGLDVGLERPICGRPTLDEDLDVRRGHAELDADHAIAAETDYSDSDSDSETDSGSGSETIREK